METSWTLGEFEIRPRERRLLRAGVSLPLGARAFDLLLALLQHHDRVVGKDELLALVWPGVVVEENNLTVQVSALRKVLGPDCIATIPGRGYQLCARPLRAGLAPGSAPENLPAALEPLAVQWPWVAVLPFTNMSDDPAQDYFAYGMVDDIITALARTGVLQVIARNSSFTYKGRVVDIKQVGAELGVRYVLEGGVRKAGGHVRINAQLIDAETGGHVWADRFDGSIEDVFELQDRITQDVVAATGTRVFMAEFERARRRPTNDLQAYDFLMRAGPWLNPSAAPAERDQAQGLLKQALERDPKFTLAKAFLAMLHGLRIMDGHGDVQDMRAGVRWAEEALADHRDDPMTLSLAGVTIAALGIRLMGVTVIGFRYDAGMAAVARALALSPVVPTVQAAAGSVNLYVGEADLAISHFERAQRLNPVGPDRSVYSSSIGSAHYLRGRYDDALAWAERAIIESPGSTAAHRIHTIALSKLGRMAEARQSARQVLMLAPKLTVSRYMAVFPLQDAKLRKELGALLKSAGIPA